MKFNKKLVSLAIILMVFIFPAFIIDVNSNEESWTRRWPNIKYASDIVIDSQNNIYVLGLTYDHIGLLKFNRTGDLIGDIIWDLGNPVDGLAIVLDEGDNLYIAGTIDDDLSDAFIMKCDSEGNLLWNHTWGGTYNERCRGLVIDSFNNSYIIGDTDSFGEGWRDTDIFITKFNSSGSKLWNITWAPSTTWEHFNAVTIDRANNLYILGDLFYYPYKQFIVKLNSSGTELWNITISRYTSYQDIAMDSEDNIIFANERHLIKLNSSGDIIWTHNISKSNHGLKVAIDSNDNIFIVENRHIQCLDYIYFDQNLPCFCTAIYLDKYDNFGNLIWKKRCTGCSGIFFGGITLDALDNIYICGTIHITSLGDCSLGYYNIILMKNPKNFSGLCLSIPYDLIIVIVSIIGICIFILFRSRKKRRSGLVEAIP